MRPTFPADQSAGRVWAADTNGANGYTWGGYPAMTDFHIIPTNQDFYVVGSVNANAIFKVSRLYFASSGMFRQFFIERDKGPIHPDGRRCPT